VNVGTWDYLFTVSEAMTEDGPMRCVPIPYNDWLLWHYAYLLDAPVCHPRQSPQPQ
jgi:hypothetical protein